VRILLNKVVHRFGIDLDYVPFEARNDVKMDVKDALCAMWSGVVKNLKTVDPELFSIELTDLVNHPGYVLKHRSRHIEHVFIMSFWDNQCVVWCNRSIVQKCETTFTFKDIPGFNS